jgi:hypothetical protein
MGKVPAGITANSGSTAPLALNSEAVGQEHTPSRIVLPTYGFWRKGFRRKGYRSLLFLLFLKA